MEIVYLYLLLLLEICYGLQDSKEFLQFIMNQKFKSIIFMICQELLVKQINQYQNGSSLNLFDVLVLKAY